MNVGKFYNIEGKKNVSLKVKGPENAAYDGDCDNKICHYSLATMSVHDKDILKLHNLVQTWVSAVALVSPRIRAIASAQDTAFSSRIWNVTNPSWLRYHRTYLRKKLNKTQRNQEGIHNNKDNRKSVTPSAFVLFVPHKNRHIWLQHIFITAKCINFYFAFDNWCWFEALASLSYEGIIKPIC